MQQALTLIFIFLAVSMPLLAAEDLPELVKELNKDYQEELNEIVEKAREDYNEAKEKYRKRLDKELERATRKGDLDIAMAIRAEINALDQKQGTQDKHSDGAELFGMITEAAPAYLPGLVCEYYKPDAALHALPDYSKIKPDARKVVHSVDANAFDDVKNFAIRFIGFLDIPADGEYEFTSRSDDGIRLIINEKQVLLDDGIHPARLRSGTIALKKGKVPVIIEFFQGGGGKALQLSMQAPGVPKQFLKNELLFHSPEQNRKQ